MRNPHRIVARTSLIAMRLAPAVVRADEFSEFRIPDHRVFSAITNLRGTLSKDHAQLNPGAHSRRNDAGLGLLEGSGLWWHDSGRGYTPLAGAAHLDGSCFRRNSRSDVYIGLPVPTRRFDDLDALGRHVRETVFLTGDARRYPWTSPVAVALSWSAVPVFTQNWGRQVFNSRFEGPGATTWMLSTINDERHLRISASRSAYPRAAAR